VAATAEEKRRRIVEAATRLFSLYGFKRTSVELLAAEAEVAKPTIYAYFADKEAIFGAVVEAVCDELLASARLATTSKGSTADRLAGMLAAKFTRYFELVQASPHAQELIDSQNRLGATLIERADAAYLALLADYIESSELDPAQVGLDAIGAARLLLRVASGAAYDATSPANHRRHLDEAVRVIAAAMTGPAAATGPHVAAKPQRRAAKAPAAR
jgi:AcrR family transcriptional regulator